MGDIADMILEGLISEDTGELIDGDAPGYPRKMAIFSPVSRKTLKGRWGDISKTQCPICSKHLKSELGVKQHIQDKHPSWRKRE